MPYAKSVECATSLPPHPPYRASLFCLTSTRSATEVNAAPTHAHQRRSFETAITACVSPHALGNAINGDGASSQRRSLTLTVAVHVPSQASGTVTEGDGALPLYHMFARTAATRVPPHVSEPGAIVRAVLGQDSVAVLSGPDLAKSMNAGTLQLSCSWALPDLHRHPKQLNFCVFLSIRPASHFEIHTILRPNLACNTSSELIHRIIGDMTLACVHVSLPTNTFPKSRELVEPHHQGDRCSHGNTWDT